MKLLVNPENGWIHVLRDNDMERTIFFARPGASFYFVCAVKDEEELIKIPIYYNHKESIIVVDGVELESEVEVSVKKDEFVETFAFLGEAQLENYCQYAKPFLRAND